MSWSYDPNDLNSTTESGRINTVRLLIGDTQTLDQQIQDEEIQFTLSEYNDVIYSAAATASRMIAAKYARLVNTELDGALRADYSDLRGHYMLLSQTLEDEGKLKGSNLGVLAGGILRSKVSQVRGLNNRVKPSFTRDDFHNPPNQDGLGVDGSDY